MDYIKLAVVGATVSLLSGCLATSALQSQWSDETEDVGRPFLEDTIHAMGKPTKPIKDHPHALVLAGEKYDYLLEGYHQTAIVHDIFTSLDTRHLFFGNDDFDPFTNLNKNQQITIYSSLGATASMPSYAMYQAKRIGVRATSTVVHFIKPTNQVSQTETHTLTTLNFQCTTKAVQHIHYTHCQRQTPIEFTPITKTIDITKLEHRFTTPYQLHANYIHEKSSVGKNAGIALLMPLAVAVDIVTFPFQLPFATLKP